MQIGLRCLTFSLGLIIIQSYCSSLFLKSVDLDPFGILRLTIDNKEFTSSMIFKQDYDILISDDLGNKVDYLYPYANTTLNSPSLTIRIFNYASSKKMLNITGCCLELNQNCELDTLYRVLLVEDERTPFRAILGSNNVFAIIITKDISAKASLPTNLFTETQEIFIDFPIADFPSNFSYSTTTPGETLFDSSYWNNIDTVALPWIPFFSRCTQQDKRIILYDVLEHSPANCTYVSQEQTRSVRTIPTTGFTAKSDKCSLSFNCFHINTGRGKSYGTPWYQIDNEPLFYIYRKAITISEMISLKFEEESGNHLFQRLSKEHSPDLIPVNFIKEDSLGTGYPQTVELKIRYIQQSQTEKQIITAEVHMKDYTGTLDVMDPKYQLIISYKAMDYFGMINSFKVGILLYLVVFLFVALILVAAVYILWRINKHVFSKKGKFPPTLKLSATFKVTFFPQLSGSIYATIATVVIYTFLMKYIIDVIDFSSFSPNFLSATNSSIIIENSQKGRIGLICLFFSLMVLKKGASLIIPIPTKEEAKIIEGNLMDNQGKKKLDKSLDTSSSEDSFEELLEGSLENSLLQGAKKDEIDETKTESVTTKSALDIKKEKKIKGNTIIITLKRKQQHFVLICMLTALILLFVIRPSDNTVSANQSTFVMVLLLVVDVVAVLILKNFVLREILLLAPMTMAFEIVQFMIVLRAGTFVLFIWSYLLRMGLIVLFRIYIDPILKNSEPYVQRLFNKLVTIPQFAFLETYFAKKTEETKPLYENIGLILGSQVKNHSESNIEYIVFTLVNFTTKQAARFMFPALLLFNYFFANESNVPTLYGITREHLSYYVLFWMVLLIPAFLIDIYLLNILEIVHGYKLHDYLSYCDYRFNLRTTKWIANTKKMDLSVSQEHRSIHNFCFSKQFYFTICIAAWGILLFMLGIYIMAINKHKPFADSATFPILFTLIIVVRFCKWLLSKASNHINLWKLPKKKVKSLSKRIEAEKKKFEMFFEYNKMFQTSAFRGFFLKEQKSWIIKNLKRLIKTDDFLDNDEYLLKLYQMLVDEELREKNEKIRKELVDKRKHEHLLGLTFKDYAQDAVKKAEGNLYMPDEQVLRVKKIAVKPMTFLVYYWKNFASQNIYLREMIHDIDISKLKTLCEKCSQEYSLQVVQKLSMREIVEQYRLQIAGLPFNKYEWRLFYEKNQKFKTLCEDCRTIYFLKKRSKKRYEGDPNKKVPTNSVEEYSLSKPKKNTIKIPTSLKKALLFWKIEANTKKLHYPQETEKKLETMLSNISPIKRQRSSVK